MGENDVNTSGTDIDRPLTMENHEATADYTVIVGGAGPAGCLFARDLARAGIRVTVLEKLPREELGHNWSSVIAPNILQGIGLPIPSGGSSVNVGPMVKGTGDGVELYEQFGMQTLQVCAPDYSSCKDLAFNYILVDQRALNQVLLDQAIAAGAEVKFEQEVQDLQVIGLGGLERVQVMGIYGRDIPGGKDFALQASLVVDATGSSSVLRTKLPQSSGIASRFSEQEFNKVYRTIRRRDVVGAIDDEISNHHRYVSSGYTWVHTYDLVTIDVGAMAENTDQAPNPTSLVSEFLFAHPSITLETACEKLGLCLVARSPLSLVASGFLSIGDAAAQVNPTTAYGLSGGLYGSKIAAETVIAAAMEGQNDIGALWPYNYNWFASSRLGANYAGLWVLRHVLRELSAEDLNFLFQTDVLNDDFLSAATNGMFDIPTWQDKVISLMKGFTRPSLLAKLNRSVILGKKVFDHYCTYPSEWDPSAYNAWCAKADDLFQKVGK